MSKETASKKKSGEKYIEAVGRRKTSIARVRISESKSNSFVMANSEKTMEEYFPTKELQEIVTEALKKSETGASFNVSIMVSGGGIHSQAEAVRLGVSRALVSFDEELKNKLKKSGFLKRDPRSVERKKFGLRKARRAPQWSKR